VAAQGVTTLAYLKLSKLRDRAANKDITDVDAMANWSAKLQVNSKSYTLHHLGDAVTSRSIHAALLEAYRLAVHI